MTHKKLNSLFFAPVSVSMVVLTLGAAFGVLVERGAFVGMVSASIIALITAVVGGSRFGVSSPTGPMAAAIGSVIVLDAAWLQSGNSGLNGVGLMNLTLIFAAGILFVLTLLKIHRLIVLIPNLVVSGFMNGIALLIVLAQFQAMQTETELVLMLATFAVAMIATVLTKNVAHPVVQLISGSLFVIIVMSLAALAFGIHTPVTAATGVKDLLSLFTLPQFSAVNLQTLPIILPLAAELALIALLDTLMTAMIMDKKTNTKSHHLRELGGQSLSLAAMSSFGGVAGAQSTVPSIMLEKEGGTGRFSKLMMALFCLIFTLLLADVVAFIPAAVFGGIILKIAFDVADFTSLKTTLLNDHGHKWIHVLFLIGTALCTVLISLNVAVIGFTVLFVLWNTIAGRSFHISDLVHEKESEGMIDEL
jgi:SulP family sulfate permease